MVKWVSKYDLKLVITLKVDYIYLQIPLLIENHFVDVFLMAQYKKLAFIMVARGIHNFSKWIAHFNLFSRYLVGSGLLSAIDVEKFNHS